MNNYGTIGTPSDLNYVAVLHFTLQAS